MKGKVIIAGAGPGDPELITVKALRYLLYADVVIVDRLVSEELLARNVKAGAKVIRVGKEAGSPSSTPQLVINDLLVEHATQDQLVVRLKGGDVGFFSNVLDELDALVTHKIPFEIIPGITAASGASAYAGIPLTARGYASSVRFLTYYSEVAWTDAYWKELSETMDTLVFYMSMDLLDTIIEKISGTMTPSNKFIAVISQATTPEQTVQVFTLTEYWEKMNKELLTSPTIIIIGKVGALHKKFSWVDNHASGKSHFESVESRDKQLSLH